MAELVDGSGEPFGDLTLLGDLELIPAGLELSVRKVGAQQEQSPADALQQGDADIVDGLGLVGRAERAGRGTELPPHEPLRDDQHAGQNEQQGGQAGK
jgi:hypothetical protein